MHWQAVARSAPGTKHLKNNIPCQDNADYEILDNNRVIIGAVSDGMGSAKHSEIGSSLAVSTALSQIKSQKYWQKKPKNNAQVEAMFGNVLDQVLKTLTQRAKCEGYSIEDLACTLLVFVATPEWLAAMQIGDGLIVVRPQNGNYELLFMPDKGEYANVTTPITAASAKQEMQVCVKPGCYEFLCTATDGIEHISLIKTEGWKPFEKFFRPLEQQMRLSQISQKQQEEELDIFLNSEEINQKTDDDKTLLFCVYREDEQQQVRIKQIKQPQPNHQNKERDTTEKRRKQSISASKLINPLPESKESLDREIELIKTCITGQLKKEGLTPSIKIDRYCLEVSLHSIQPLENKQNLLDKILQVVDSHNKRLKIKKVRLENLNATTSKVYWKSVINLTIRNQSVLILKSLTLLILAIVILCFLIIFI